MPRQNPYMMDPLLAQGFSNLTKALIGDPETDYQVARTGYQDAQTNRLNKLLPFEQQSIEAQIAQRSAAANASNSQAGLYGSQTTEQDLLNAQLQNLTSALTTLSSSPEVQAQVSAATGIDFSKATNVDAIGSALVTAMLGGQGNVDQRSSAFTNMANQANTNTAFNQIMDSTATPDQIRQAFIANGGDPGKYFDSGAARTEINYDYNAALDKNTKDLQGTQYTADRNLEGTQYNADQDLEGTRITAKSTEAYQNFKSNLQFGEGGQGDRDKAQDVVQAQWELNNKPLEFTVTPGQQIVLSPEAGVRIGLEPNDKGLYVLDGGPNPGSIVVKVGEEDVYLTEADAKALGIEKNDAGTYMIPGRANPKGSSGNNPKSVSASATKFLGDTIKTELSASGLEVPDSIQLEIRGDAANLIQEDGNTEAAATFIARALKPVVITEQNLIRFGVPVRGFSTPQYVLDQIEKIKQAAQNPSVVPSNILTMLTEDYGYDEDQAKAIMAYANIQ